MQQAIQTALAEHRGRLRTRTINPGSQQRYECSCGDEGPWHFPNRETRTGYGSDQLGRPVDELERHVAQMVCAAVWSYMAEVHANTVDVEAPGEWWRVIDTDTEGPTGVAPECAQIDVAGGLHDNVAYGRVTMLDVTSHGLAQFDALGVYDCCPWPHVETWAPAAATELVELLNNRGVRLCT
jgi:hypothetical protein